MRCMEGTFFPKWTKYKNDECKFGLKSKTFPSHITEMKKFENDLIDMIEKIKFKEVNDQFLDKLPRT
jgi:hypothetical protein